MSERGQSTGRDGTLEEINNGGMGSGNNRAANAKTRRTHEIKQSSQGATSPLVLFILRPGIRSSMKKTAAHSVRRRDGIELDREVIREGAITYLGDSWVSLRANAAPHRMRAM